MTGIGDKFEEFSDSYSAYVNEYPAVLMLALAFIMLVALVALVMVLMYFRQADKQRRRERTIAALNQPVMPYASFSQPVPQAPVQEQNDYVRLAESTQEDEQA